MKKSELRTMVREMVQAELEATAPLQEKLAGPGYVIKAWSDPEQKSGTPAFDSAKANIMYPDFDAVLDALASDKLAELGAYEITWVKSDLTEE
jgi:hypothetical protein